MPYGFSTITFTAQNQFSDPVRCPDYCILDLRGTGTMTVTIQVLPPDETDWANSIDLDGITAAGRYEIKGAGEQFRVGVKTGAFTSGTLKATIHNGGR